MRDGGRAQRILELREIQEQLQSQLYDIFELMRVQNLSEEEQRAVGGSSIACVINSSLLPTSNRGISWRQFGL
jgi:hypothetical protein